MDTVAMSFDDPNFASSGGRYRVIEHNATHEDKMWATVIHLSSLIGFLAGAVVFVAPLGSILAPLIIWLVKRNDSPFLDDHGREALNFQISIAIYYALLAISCVGIPLILVLPILQIILPIVMAVRANGGEYVRYPITIRFFK